MVYLTVMHVVQTFVWGGGHLKHRSPPPPQSEALVLHTLNNGLKQNCKTYPPILNLTRKP